MFLNQVSLEDYKKERRYFAGHQVRTIKEIHAYMTANLCRHYTLQELSDTFNIPLTSMKVCFKGVYGSPIYSYMKSYRMQAATVLLKDSSDSITEIAAKIGYDNPTFIFSGANSAAENCKPNSLLRIHQEYRFLLNAQSVCRFCV